MEKIYKPPPPRSEPKQPMGEGIRNSVIHYGQVSRQEFEELKALVLLLQKQLNKVKIPI